MRSWVCLGVCLLALVVVASAAAKLPSRKIIDTEVPEGFVPSAVNISMIYEVNTLRTTWTAGVNEFLMGRTTASVKRLLGAKLGLTKKTLALREPFDLTNVQLPDSFDWRDQKPDCVGAIRNQGECGSCWAFGCAEALSDRFCIASQGKTIAILSPLDLVTCDDNDDGCEGGDPGSAWEYCQNNGLVLEKCIPYSSEIPTCAPADQPCLNFVNTPACNEHCVDGEHWAASKHFASSAYSVSSDADQIAAEIMTNGPVEAAFSVYEDFIHYKSGVYQHTTGSYLGGHAVKIIGWGVEQGTPYWTIANSWTTTWGDQGYFKILKGQDECGIEDDIVAGAPQL